MVISWVRLVVEVRFLRKSEVVASLTDLAVLQNVAASTQNQALNALVFMYRHGIVLIPPTLLPRSKGAPIFSEQSMV